MRHSWEIKGRSTRTLGPLQPSRQFHYPHPTLDRTLEKSPLQKPSHPRQGSIDKVEPSLYRQYYYFIFFGHTQGTWKFPGQGLNSCHRSDPQATAVTRLDPSPTEPLGNSVQTVFLMELFMTSAFWVSEHLLWLSDAHPMPYPLSNIFNITLGISQ